MSRYFIKIRKASFGALIPNSHVFFPETIVQQSIINGDSKSEDWRELIPVSTIEKVETKTVEVKTCVVL